MKSISLVLTLLVAVAGAAIAQSDAPKPVQTNAEKPAQTEAQKTFAKMQSLAGQWEGKVSTTPPTPEVQDKSAQVVLRVTSMGNALLHELQVEGRKDDPITMFYVEDDRLMLTHYCDAGNRPRMTGKLLPDGNAVNFEFVDISGDPTFHMHDSRFTIVDANHHIEEWTFMMGGKPVIARFDLKRKN